MPLYGSCTSMVHAALTLLAVLLLHSEADASKTTSLRIRRANVSVLVNEPIALLQSSARQTQKLAGQQALRMATQNGLVAKHRACEAHFEKCWNSTTMQWISSIKDSDGLTSGCAQPSHKQCSDILCSSWLEANCTGFDGMCPKVNAMCLSLQELPGRRRNVNIDPEAEEALVFVHIPKNAGTAIENVAYNEHIRWGRHRMFYFGMMEMPDGLYCAAHHVPPKRLPLVMKQIYRKSDVFCVSRHPYDRAVSEYKYLLSVPWGLGKPGVLEKEPCTPEGLNAFLQLSLSMVISGQRYVNDCHMLPQTDFIVGETHSWCQDVLRIEEMPQNFNELMVKRGYPNVKIDPSVQENDSKRACPNLSLHDLSDDTKALLNLVYHRDFATLGYDKEHF